MTAGTAGTDLLLSLDGSVDGGGTANAGTATAGTATRVFHITHSVEMELGNLSRAVYRYKEPPKNF